MFSLSLSRLGDGLSREILYYRALLSIARRPLSLSSFFFFLPPLTISSCARRACGRREFRSYLLSTPRIHPSLPPFSCVRVCFPYALPPPPPSSSQFRFVRRLLFHRVRGSAKRRLRSPRGAGLPSPVRRPSDAPFAAGQEEGAGRGGEAATGRREWSIEVQVHAYRRR